jgi:hypothetical protein
MQRDMRIIVVLCANATVLFRGMWSDWAIDNGNSVSMLALQESAQCLRASGEAKVCLRNPAGAADVLLINPNFRPA